MNHQSVALVSERLAHLHASRIDLSLDRIFALLGKTGNPEKKLPPVVHVAGTNGKGSTVAFLKAFLQAAGKRVHMYTSPHLVRFNERICLNGREISDAFLYEVLTRVEKANAGEPLTFFEATTAAAFLAFSETPADFVLLETGMGGRLDATNVVDAPVAVAVTSLSMDHESFLGNTLSEIAAEKAAIIKQNRPVFAALSDEEALDVLRREARRKNAPLKIEGHDFFIDSDADGFAFNGEKFPSPALAGNHQHRNAGLALAVLKDLERQNLLKTSREIIETGLKTVFWPARLQKIDCPYAPANTEIWLDGGHNPGAGAVLADFLPQWKNKPLYVVCGMISSKDANGYLEKILPFADGFQAVPVHGGTAPSHAPEDLVAIARKHGAPFVQKAANVDEALKRFFALSAGKPARILICGSLYLAGTFLKNVKRK